MFMTTNAVLAWLAGLTVLLNLSADHYVVQHNVPPSVSEQILGTWYLEEQEILVNGREISEHFEDLAAQLSSLNDHEVDPRILADKFREKFNGIPAGTIFTFRNDFSYRIELPDHKVQQGMWRIRNGSGILLQAADHELLLRIKALGKENFVFSIREAKVDSQLGAGGYTVMELVLGLSR